MAYFFKLFCKKPNVIITNQFILNLIKYPCVVSFPVSKAATINFSWEISLYVKGFCIILDNERSSRSFTSKLPFQLQFIINKIWVGRAGRGRGRCERGPRSLSAARAGQRRGKFDRN